MNKKKKRHSSLFNFFILVAGIAYASQSGDSTALPVLYLELPLLDLPYQADAAKTVNNGNATFGSFFGGYANPGMHLSLSVSTDLYTGLHYVIGRLFTIDSLPYYGFGKRLLFSLALTGADAVSFWTPGFLGWEHEEYHRAVMSRFHVNSFNGMNRFPIGSELVSVDHVKDEDLARFKKDSPSDFIRMHVAGSEGEYQLIEKLRRNQFFYDQNFLNIGLYCLATFNSIGYVKMCGMASEADKATDEANAAEKSIESRDFTGLDFLGWTYDLFKPDEPYANRGIHPSGTGINRYIKTTDLTHEELSYLQKQGNLQFLNLLSPSLIPPSLFGMDFNRLRLSENGLIGTIAVHDYLTSFGSDISLSAFLKNRLYNFIFALHNFQNYHHWFPGLEAQMIDWVMPLFSRTLYVSPRIIIGVQPLNQGFKTDKAAFLGLAECRLELAPSEKSVINPFIELSAKSIGWVAGNEFLDRNFSVRCGIASRIAAKNK
jgi:hypothetical protein